MANKGDIMMDKKTLINKVAEVNEFTKKDTEKFLNSLQGIISEEILNGEEITLPGLGRFILEDKKERTCRNPQNGEEMIVPAHKSPKFKMSPTFKKSFRE